MVQFLHFYYLLIRFLSSASLLLYQKPADKATLTFSTGFYIVFGGQNYWQCQNKNFFKKVKLSFGQGS